MRRIHGPENCTGLREEICRQAIEPALMQLVERAEQSGWARSETVEAIRFLVAERERSAVARAWQQVA